MSSHRVSSPSVQRRKLINSILHHAKNGDWEALSQLLDKPDVQFEHATPLQAAIEGGHPEIVQRLIVRGFSVEEKGVEPYGRKCMTPLHLAARHNRAEIARILLDANADPTRLDVTDSEETCIPSEQITRTAFATAAYWDGAEVLQLLIERLPSDQITTREWEQAVANAAANRHAKALEILLRHYPGQIPQQILDQGLEQAVAYCLWDGHEMMLRPEEVLWEAQIQVIRLLIARGADPSYRGDLGSSLSILHRAISTASGLETIQTLLDHGTYVHAVGPLSFIVFSQAVYNEDPRIVRFFLEKEGAVSRYFVDPSVHQPPGGSILHVAAYGAPLETIQLLLANGADPFAQDDNGALPFHSACRAGRREVVELLWSLSRTESNHLESMVTKDGWTPLLLITCCAPIEDGAISVLKFLIEKGADVNCQTSDGLTALHHAIKYTSPEFMELLLQARAKLSRTPTGDTELHLAMQDGILEIVAFLLQYGADADVNVEDQLGRTPLSFYVRQYGPYANEDMIDLLVKHGADVEARDSEGKTIKEWAIERLCRYNWDKLVVTQK